MSQANSALDTPARPTPSPDQDSAFFWEGLRAHEFRLQECTDCGKRRFPPMPTCPFCAGRHAKVVIPTGRGKVYSWVAVHHAFHPAFKADLPYIVATIDLEGGGRMAARVDTQAPEKAQISIGQVVKAGYLDHGEWTELRFSAEPMVQG